MKITVAKTTTNITGQNFEVQILDVKNSPEDAATEGRDLYDIGGGFAKTAKDGVLAALELLDERGIELPIGTQISIL